MNRFLSTVLRVLGITILALMLITLLLAAALYSGLAQLEWPRDAIISINGQGIELASLGVGHALLAAGGVMLALLIVFTVVPLALLGSGLLVTLSLAIAALAVGGVALVLFSPLLVIGFVIWLAVRRSRRTTMAA